MRNDHTGSRAIYEWLHAVNPHLPDPNDLEPESKVVLTMATATLATVTVSLPVTLPPLPAGPDSEVTTRDMIQSASLAAYEWIRETNPALPVPEKVTADGFTLTLRPGYHPVLTVAVLVAVPLTPKDNQGDQTT